MGREFNPRDALIVCNFAQICIEECVGVARSPWLPSPLSPPCQGGAYWKPRGGHSAGFSILRFVRAAVSRLHEHDAERD
jgi:hypothetical protein